MLNTALRLDWLTAETLLPYRPLAPAGIDAQLEVLGPLRPWQRQGCHALGVNLLGLPLGLLLLQTRGTRWGRTAEVISLAVAERFRRQGLATRLLDTVLQACDAARIRLISLSYPLGQSSEPAMARLCHPARGWQAVGGTVLYSCRVAEVPAFLASLRPFAERLATQAPLTCVAYGSLAGAQLRRAQSRLRPPRWATPPLPKSTASGWGALDLECSQALVLGGAVVGWCLCHRISSTAHRITIAYVAENLQSRGFLVLPVLGAVQALATPTSGVAYGPDHGIRFGVRLDNGPMIRFAERRIQPFAQAITQTTEMARPFAKYGDFI